MSDTTEASTVLTHYDERREVSLHVDVAGAPVLHPRHGPDLTPSSVQLTYTKRVAGRWAIRARVYGLPTTGSSQLWNTWADVYGDGADWPAWLRAIADQRHPDGEA